MAEQKVESRAEHQGEGTPTSRSATEPQARAAESRLGGIHTVASDGVFLVRDVASDAVRAVGDIGTVAVDTTHDLLVGVADGLRDVITHIIPFGSRREASPPPAERK